MMRFLSIILSIITLVLNLFQFQKNETFTVDFINYDNTVISSCEVAFGESAITPVSPQKTGATFLGWQGNYINVQKDETVKAIFDDEKNVFMISSASSKIGDTVTLLVSLDGDVETCGFDMTINYDEALELVSSDCDLDLDIIANTQAGNDKIMLNYSSATNKKRNYNIMKLVFKINSSQKDALAVKMEISSIKKVDNNKVLDADYSLINSIIYIK